MRSLKFRTPRLPQQTLRPTEHLPPRRFIIKFHPHASELFFIQQAVRFFHRTQTHRPQASQTLQARARVLLWVKIQTPQEPTL